MPKIPLYNEGQGQQVRLATGQLSRRPDVSAFTAVGQASASFARSAGNIARDFAAAERKREDQRILAEELKKAYDDIGTHNIEDQSSNLEDASKSFDEAAAKIVGDIRNKKYGKRREDLVITRLSQLFMSKKLEAKNNAHNRGQANSARASDDAVLTGFETMRSNMPGTPQFELAKDLIINMTQSSERDGLPVKINSAKARTEFINIEKQAEQSSISESIRAASTENQVTALQERISGSNLSAAVKDQMRNLSEQRLTQIKDEEVFSFGDYIAIDTDLDNEFTSLQIMEEKYRNATKGDFGADEELQKTWNGLDDKQKERVKTLLKGNIDELRQNQDITIKRKTLLENRANDKIFTDNIPNIRSGQLTPTEIRQLNFVGAEGEKLRGQLLTVAANRLVGAELTIDNLQADTLIRRRIDRNEIVSLTQKFKLPGEQENLSILERENVQLTSARVDEYADFFRQETRQRAGIKERLITQFLDSKKLEVAGSSLLLRTPTAESNERVATFNNFIRQEIRKGEQEGKTVEQMLNNLDSANFIAPDMVMKRFKPSKATLLQEAKGYFQAKDILAGITYEEALAQMPTRQDMGLPINASFAEVEKHPLYQSWKEGVYGLRVAQGQP